MTKKWTALLLAAVLAVGLSACDTSRAEAPAAIWKAEFPPSRML